MRFPKDEFIGQNHKALPDTQIRKKVLALRRELDEMVC